ncbi:phosphomevalonate kinase [Filibacter tadaridae]|uniref:phosphomevalonate kinase n=1 Tax=Filibacter tadaridae TaxID=2483811 RepID=A0A3P5X0M8_9BACL|nr:phosphomevalonate kinase [Filibacter tadaridae]VDC28935.1 mevalonate kinase [Filibacter tadaridae]
MIDANYHIRVPGKLFIAGEYAILEPRGQSIVVAVDRYIEATIKPCEVNRLSLPQLGLDSIIWTADGHTIHFSESSQKLRYVQYAITTFNQFLQERLVGLQPFSLTITSELDDVSGKKYGLGSSAAVVVTVITAMANLYEHYTGKPTALLIYKLSAIAHIQAQGNGSCADIAASTYGGWLHYTAFQSDWLLAELKDGTPLHSLMTMSWPNLEIMTITPPEELRLCVGWTGSDISTGPMINHIHHLQEHQPLLYSKFLDRSEKAVSRMVTGFKNKNYLEALSSLSQNREALKSLGEDGDVPIETPTLKRLIQIADKYGGGKTSGSGGGDCGIAFVNEEHKAEQVYIEWLLEGIMPLRLSVSETGAIAEKLN